MELFFVGLRNVFRNRRRTVLNSVALVIAVFLMILGFGWVNGYQVYLFESVITFETGHLQILPAGYLDERARLPVDLTIADYDARRRALMTEHPEIAEATGRILFSVELSNGRRSVRLLGRGIDPKREARVTVLDDYISRGSYLGTGVLIGAPIAERMSIEPGGTVFLTAVDSDGVRNVVDARVAGVFDFGYPAIDRNVIYVDLATAQSLLSLQDQVTKIVVRLSPESYTDAVPAELSSWAGGDEYSASATGNAGDEQGLAVYPWQRFAETTVSAVRADTASFWLMLGILYVLIVLGILNSMSMAIHERTGEIATLRAIGMKKRHVLGLFLSEGIGLALVATAAGILITVPVAAYLQYRGINVGAALPDDLPIPFGERFYAAFRFWHFAVAALVAIGTAVLGSVLPAYRGTRVRMAAALQGKR
jgi:putative ABC transport system permease protein